MSAPRLRLVRARPRKPALSRSESTRARSGPGAVPMGLRPWPIPIGSCYLQPRGGEPRQPAKARPIAFEDTLPPLSLGPVEADRARTKSQQVFRLAELRDELMAEDIQNELQVSQDAAHQLLWRLAAAGKLVRRSVGVYARG